MIEVSLEQAWTGIALAWSLLTLLGMGLAAAVGWHSGKRAGQCLDCQLEEEILEREARLEAVRRG